MSRNAAIETILRNVRLARLRGLIARRRMSLGRIRGNIFQRLSLVLIAAKAARYWPNHPAPSHIVKTPSCLLVATSLGLGISGGGGGSPGRVFSVVKFSS